jgi:hypothetical protein
LAVKVQQQDCLDSGGISSRVTHASSSSAQSATTDAQVNSAIGGIGGNDDWNNDLGNLSGIS